MTLLVDVDNGEMPIGDRLEISEVPIVIKHVSSILNSIATDSLIPQGKIMSYGFVVNAKYRAILDKVLDEINLPPRCKYYSIEGRKVFEMRGASGGVMTGVVFYLIAT